MSTSPDTSVRPDDQLVTLLSRWLARHVSDDELRHGIDAVDRDELAPAQAEAVAELVEELDRSAPRGDLEMVARETLEALALEG